MGAPLHEGREPLEEVTVRGVLVEAGGGGQKLSTQPAQVVAGARARQGEPLQGGRSRGPAGLLATVWLYLLGILKAEKIERHHGLWLEVFVSDLLPAPLLLAPLPVGLHPPLESV